MVPPAARDLQIALRDAFVFESAFFQHPARGGVLGQAGSFDPAQVHRGEGMVDDREDRLSHVAATLEGFADPVAQRACL